MRVAKGVDDLSIKLDRYKRGGCCSFGEYGDYSEEFTKKLPVL